MILQIWVDDPIQQLLLGTSFIVHGQSVKWVIKKIATTTFCTVFFFIKGSFVGSIPWDPLAYSIDFFI